MSREDASLLLSLTHSLPSRPISSPHLLSEETGLVLPRGIKLLALGLSLLSR